MENPDKNPEKRQKVDNLIQVSNKKDVKFFLYIARKMLDDHKEIEVTAIGESISNAIIIAETLCRNNQTQWKNIFSQTIESKFQNHKKIKVSIKLLKI